MAAGALGACFVFCSTYEASEPPSDAGGADDADDAGEASDDDATSTDAADAAVATRYCEIDAGQIFCADFDVGSMQRGWDSVALPVGTLVTDGDASTSPPLALVATAPVTTQFQLGARLEKTFDGDYQSLTCSFSVRRELVGGAIISMAELRVETAGNDYELGAFAETTSGLLRYVDIPSDGGNAIVSDQGAPLAFPVGEWHRVGLQLTPQRARIYVDGALVSARVRGTVPTPLTTTFKLGIPTIEQPNDTPWRFRYDDVQCVKTP